MNKDKITDTFKKIPKISKWQLNQSVIFGDNYRVSFRKVDNNVYDGKLSVLDDEYRFIIFSDMFFLLEEKTDAKVRSLTKNNKL